MIECIFAECAGHCVQLASRTGHCGMERELDSFETVPQVTTTKDKDAKNTLTSIRVYDRTKGSFDSAIFCEAMKVRVHNVVQSRLELGMAPSSARPLLTLTILLTMQKVFGTRCTCVCSPSFERTAAPAEPHYMRTVSSWVQRLCAQSVVHRTPVPMQRAPGMKREGEQRS